MPEPPAGKSTKLPKWAYITAAGIGVLLVFFLFRSKGSSADTLEQPRDVSPDNTDMVYNLYSALAAMLAGHPNATTAGSDSDGNSGSSGGDPGPLNNGDLDPTKGPIPSGLPCHPHPPTEKGHCKPGDSLADGSPYACGWCASGSCIKHAGLVDVCA